MGDEQGSGSTAQLKGLASGWQESCLSWRWARRMQGWNQGRKYKMTSQEGGCQLGFSGKRMPNGVRSARHLLEGNLCEREGDGARRGREGLQVPSRQADGQAGPQTWGEVAGSSHPPCSPLAAAGGCDLTMLPHSPSISLWQGGLRSTPS